MTNDRINGVFAIGNLEEYFDEKKVKMAQDDIKKSKGLVIVYGIGASRVVKGNILIYNNITIQRIKDGFFGKLENWGMKNPDEDPLTKEKIFNFVAK